MDFFFVFLKNDILLGFLKDCCPDVLTMGIGVKWPSPQATSSTVVTHPSTNLSYTWVIQYVESLSNSVLGLEPHMHIKRENIGRLGKTQSLNAV